MRHHFEIQCVPGVRVGVLGLMAEDAHWHTDAAAAMERQLIVARVAALGADDVACDRHRRAVGDEVESRAGVICPKVENGQVARAIYPDGSSDGGIEPGWRLGRERICILTRSPWSCDAGAFASRLGYSARDGARGSLRGIGEVLFLAFGDVSSNKAERDYAGSSHAGRIQRQARRIRECVRHTDNAAASDSGRVDGDRQAREHEIDQGLIRVESLIAGRIGRLGPTHQGNRSSHQQQHEEDSRNSRN